MSNQSVDYSLITMVLSAFSLGLSIITVVILVMITDKMQYKEFTKSYRRYIPLVPDHHENYVKSANKVE